MGKWSLVAWSDPTQMLILWEMYLNLRSFSSHLESWEMCSLYVKCPKGSPPDPYTKLFHFKKMECLVF